MSNTHHAKFENYHIIFLGVISDYTSVAFNLSSSLEQVNNAKYLGVNITEKLHWGKHVDNITAKANKTTGFICRNLKGCPVPVKTHCFKTLVRPILDYASPVWDPHQQVLKEKLESTQKRAARRILQNYDRMTSGSTLVEKLNLNPLSQRRAVDKAAMVYKIVNSEVDIQATDYFIPTTRQLRGQQNQFQIPRTRLDVHKFSFFSSSIRIWNSLPQSAVTANTVSAFKGQLTDWARKF